MLDDNAIHVFDGATGTMLQAKGLAPGQSPEIFGLENPELVAELHAEYVRAGARCLTTNTFGGTAPKLPHGADARQISRAMAEAARKAGGDACCVAGSVGPTGLFIEPMGEMSFRQIKDIFAAQIKGLAEGGADLIKAETHFDLAELRAVVVAAREVSDLPVLACMTFEDGATLTGASPEVFADALQNMGVDAIGINCSAGPAGMAELVAGLLPRLSVPLHVQPNAGLPQLVDGETVFPMGPEEFARNMRRFIDLGAKFMGGCCGTTPDHIRALAGALAEETWNRPEPDRAPALVLTSRSESVPMGWDHPFVVIGERINPTGKEDLTEQLQKGTLTRALELAGEQVQAGARVLDVNVGAPMVEEAAVLPELVKALGERVRAPLCIDTADAEAAEAALWATPGSALVNSISGEPGRMERLGPLCAKFGAGAILLPLTGGGLPVTAAERLKIIEDLLVRAQDLGIPRRLLMVDALALTVSSKPEAARSCLEVIRVCREKWGLPTVMGLSNISFGLPARELVNATFLAMCMSQGMAAAIANPSSARLAEALAAGEVLLGRDTGAERFIAGFSGWTPGEGGRAPGAGGPAKKAEGLHAAVVLGDREGVVPFIEAELEAGADPFALVNEKMIPAILEVGDKYEKKEYFLPQLMASAETMQAGFDRLAPLLEEGGAAEKPRVVMATVEGDIHDIGKNIVSLMLGNHGFEVVDLGKDVKAADIVDRAEELEAAVIGLSALMTTTMVRMAEVVDLVRERGLKAKVMLGGAVLSRDYADSIGAHGFAPDAVAAVRLAEELAGVKV
jgi:5-methyltetrahydrofolate--homocysteine methyltransferase